MFARALLQEIRLRTAYLGGESIETVYFGGGTPSQLDPSITSMVLDALARDLSISPEPEITLEANPEDVTPAWLHELVKTPVNRLSLGVQSFFDDDLAFLGRTHDAAQAMHAINLIREAGYHNLGIDLIYGIPTLTQGKWLDNLDRFLSFGLPHLSAYALTIEEGTLLARQVKQNVVAGPAEEETAVQFEALVEVMQEAGYVHYEISNFAREGLLSKHNTSYWKGIKYFGLGPSAHSYDGISRQWNLPDVSLYIRSVMAGTVPFEKEILTPQELYNEYIMTSLRTMWGIDLGHVESRFGKRFLSHLENCAWKYLQQQYLSQAGKLLTLTSRGKLFADRVAMNLFADDDLSDAKPPA
jgi:oxygen-independent coproporphyrinogen-3 oxidase